MTAKQSLANEVGRLGEPFEMEVERGKIYEFARATSATHPDYRAERPIAPPTFLTTTFFWEQLVPESNPWVHLPLDLRRTMHAEQEFEFLGPPPRAGTRLRCQAKIEEIYEKQGRRGGTLTFAVMVTEFRALDGTLVARARMTGVETSQAPEEKTP